MSKILRVYVAGPYTKGDVAVNVRTAIEVGNTLRSLGFSPFVPHLTHFWHMLFPKAYEYWLTLDLEWLEVCDALFRFPGESRGADHEVEVARKLGIPVFDRYSDMQRWKISRAGKLHG